MTQIQRKSNRQRLSLIIFKIYRLILFPDGLKTLLSSADVQDDSKMFGFLQKGYRGRRKLPEVHRPSDRMLSNARLKKWVVPRYMYKKKYFPQFLSGSGYLVKKTSARCLLDMSQKNPIVHLEDVYITGLCAAECNIRRISYPGFKARPEAATRPLQPTDVVIHYVDEVTMHRFYNQSKSKPESSIATEAFTVIKDNDLIT